MLIRYVIVYGIGLVAALYMTWEMDNKSIQLWLIRLLMAGFFLFVISLMQPRKNRKKAD